MALKSRVLLFAASPLYNGGSPAEEPALKELTGYPSHDETRWLKALQAAQDVVNLGVYELKTDNATRPGNGFYELFLERVSDEIRSEEHTSELQSRMRISYAVSCLKKKNYKQKYNYRIYHNNS